MMILMMILLQTSKQKVLLEISREPLYTFVKCFESLLPYGMYDVHHLDKLTD